MNKVRSLLASTTLTVKGKIVNKQSIHIYFRKEQRKERKRKNNQRLLQFIRCENVTWLPNVALKSIYNSNTNITCETEPSHQWVSVKMRNMAKILKINW